jgi:hypothetical protein
VSVSARFKLDQAARNDYGVEVRMSAAIDEDNSEWAKYTPSGQISMNVSGPAAPWFEEHVGQVVAITFDENPKEN